MPVSTRRLTTRQVNGLQKIADAWVYSPGREMRDVFYVDSHGTRRTESYMVPSRATLVSLWRRELIEFGPEPSANSETGEPYGWLLQLTPMGRHALRESAPRTFTGSWRTEITPGRHPRKRTSQLKVGDLILMAWTDGRKEWRRITEVKMWLKSMPDWREITTESTDGARTSVENDVYPGSRRWTVQPANEEGN